MRRIAAALVLAVVALPGCGVTGLSFVQDRRVHIVSPGDRTEVTLPVTIDWEVTDFAVTGPDGSSTDDVGSFGVFVDAAPPPPGRPLAWLARDDRQCLPQNGCPDEEYLAERRAYSTSETEFTIEVLSDLTREAQQREFHEVIVVLLDGEGNRIGEGAWTVEFQVVREGD